jgi:hypothetical protein
MIKTADFDDVNPILLAPTRTGRSDSRLPPKRVDDYSFNLLGLS